MTHKTPPDFFGHYFYWGWLTPFKCASSESLIYLLSIWWRVRGIVVLSPCCFCFSIFVFVISAFVVGVVFFSSPSFWHFLVKALEISPSKAAGVRIFVDDLIEGNSIDHSHLVMWLPTNYEAMSLPFQAGTNMIWYEMVWVVSKVDVKCSEVFELKMRWHTCSYRYFDILSQGFCLT